MIRWLLTLALALALLTPARVHAQTELAIEVDRGAGATYILGESLVIRYRAPRQTYIRILNTAINGTTVVVEGSVSGAGELPLAVALPVGQRVLTLQTYTGAQLQDTTQTSYNVIAKAPVEPRELGCGAGQGQLAAPIDVEAWTFNGAIGQSVAVRVDSVAGLPIRVISPSGALIATGTNSAYATLAVAGQYRVEVGGASMAVAGAGGPMRYSISVECAGGSGGPVGAVVASNAIIDCGGSVTGQIAAITDAQTWNVRLPVGQQITLAARSTVPLPIRIYDAQGALVAGSSSEIRSFSPADAGVYQVTVGYGIIANAPSPIDYTLSIGCVTPPPPQIPNSLPCSSITPAQLANLHDTNRFNFAGITGHTISVQVFAPTPLPVQVIGVNGSVMSSGTGSIRIPITGPTGLYTIVVGGVETVEPGGPISYTISLNCGG